MISVVISISIVTTIVATAALYHNCKQPCVISVDDMAVVNILKFGFRYVTQFRRHVNASEYWLLVS